MKPAPPVTSSFMRGPRGRRRGRPARRGARGCRARSRAPSTPACVRGGGTRRWSRAAPGSRRPLARRSRARTRTRSRSPLPVTCRNPRSPPRRERQQRLGQVAGEGWAAHLVVDHAQLVAFARQAENGLHEVPPSGAEQPRRAHDQVVRVRVRRGPLARQLGAPVLLDRRGGVGLHVRLALAAVEDVVGRDVEHAPGGLGHVARAFLVHGVGGRAVALGPVDVGVGRAVDHRRAGERLAHRGGVGHVELRARQRQRPRRRSPARCPARACRPLPPRGSPRGAL